MNVISKNYSCPKGHRQLELKLRVAGVYCKVCKKAYSMARLIMFKKK